MTITARHLIATVLALWLPLANSAVLTFDDLPTPGPYLEGNVPNGYGGLNWTNMGVHNVSGSPNSGYAVAAVSGSNVAFNYFAGLAVTSGAAFDFVGAYFTGAWNDGLNINVEGYNAATLLYNATFSVSVTQPTWKQLDMLNVTELRFTSSGGVPWPDWVTIGGGSHFAMDNFTYEAVVPIPAAAWLIAPAVGLLAPWVKRRQATA